MDVYEIISSPGCTLSEQVAQQVFEFLPEDGFIVAIMDREGNFWASEPEEYSKLNISRSFLEQLWANVDDGVEPVTVQVGQTCVTMTQLATERTNCGYVLIALRRHNPESISMTMELVEVVMHQICLIARLIERNNLLHELQQKRYRVYGSSVIASN